nr:hypothetical protein [Lachnospiraceae bacterium]
GNDEAPAEENVPAAPAVVSTGRVTPAGTPVVTTSDELDIPDEASATAAEPTTANTEADIPDEASATAAKPTFTVTDEATATAAAPSEEASNLLWLLILAGLAVIATAGETARRVIKNKKNISK